MKEFVKTKKLEEILKINITDGLKFYYLDCFYNNKGCSIYGNVIEDYSIIDMGAFSTFTHINNTLETIINTIMENKVTYNDFNISSSFINPSKISIDSTRKINLINLNINKEIEIKTDFLNFLNSKNYFLLGNFESYDTDTTYVLLKVGNRLFQKIGDIKDYLIDNISNIKDDSTVLCLNGIYYISKSEIIDSVNPYIIDNINSLILSDVDNNFYTVASIDSVASYLIGYGFSEYPYIALYVTEDALKICHRITNITEISNTDIVDFMQFSYIYYGKRISCDYKIATIDNIEYIVKKASNKFTASYEYVLYNNEVYEICLRKEDAVFLNPLEYNDFIVKKSRLVSLPQYTKTFFSFEEFNDFMKSNTIDYQSNSDIKIDNSIFIENKKVSISTSEYKKSCLNGVTGIVVKHHNNKIFATVRFLDYFEETFTIDQLKIVE